MEKDRERFFIGFVASLAAGTIVLWSSSRLSKSTFALSTLINPSSVAGIAAQLPQDEDSFILAAWDIVGSDIIYEGYGSEIKFFDSTVSCQRCLLAQQVLKKRRANCVGKSILLVSLLRNRIADNRVYMAVGQLHADSIGGHAWVSVLRGGQWYLLEATLPPPTPNPWVLAEAKKPMYETEALVNDQGLICASEELCIKVKKTSCLCSLLQD